MSLETPARAWTPPQGHADVAPSRYDRIEGDGYLTLDAWWVVPALLRSVLITGAVLEPACGRGHISLELRRAGLDVTSFDLRRYADPLVDDIGAGDIRELKTLRSFTAPAEGLARHERTHFVGASGRSGGASLR